jgi:hypothetical protein
MSIFKIVDLDAWSHGQIKSKLWLANELEPLCTKDPVTIWLLGGWYGQLAFMLSVRENLNINRIISFDIDSEAEAISEKINNMWHYQEWQFKAIKQDINLLDYSKPYEYFSEEPDAIINTSTEHMKSNNWFENIPAGKLVVLQGTDMDINDHINRTFSLEEFLSKYPLSLTHYSGELLFEYSDTWKFKRFMIIGNK